MHSRNNIIENEYGIKAKCATMSNPQENPKWEGINKVIVNLLYTFEPQNNYLDKYDPWSGIPAATYFGAQISYHTTLQATPVQLVSLRDIMLNTPFVADWESIRRPKQLRIDKNNQTENENRKPHHYRVSEKVLVRNKQAKNTRRRMKAPTQLLRSIQIKLLPYAGALYKSV